jgi:hypothetical protein
LRRPSGGRLSAAAIVLGNAAIVLGNTVKNVPRLWQLIRVGERDGAAPRPMTGAKYAAGAASGVG